MENELEVVNIRLVKEPSLYSEALIVPTLTIFILIICPLFFIFKMQNTSLSYWDNSFAINSTTACGLSNVCSL